MSLDLHGVPHKDVIKEVDAFLWHCVKNRRRECQIITGNSTRMKNLAIESILDHGFSYQIGDHWNSGYIIVYI